MTARAGKAATLPKVRGGIGPRARPERLARLDMRTPEGKFVRALEAELVADLGGNPSAAQRLLIKALCFKALRLALLTRGYAKAQREGIPEATSRDERFLKFSGSLREDLRTLGLERVSKAGHDLDAYLAGKLDES